MPLRYPFAPPKVFVKNCVLHPNVDVTTGELYLEILSFREWKPVFTINSIIFAIESVLYEPNLEYYPNTEFNIGMVNLLRTDLDGFKQIILCALAGGTYFGMDFESNFGASISKKRKRDANDNEDGIERTYKRRAVQN